MSAFFLFCLILIPGIETQPPEVVYDKNGVELWMSTTFLEDGNGSSLNKKVGLSPTSRFVFENYLTSLSRVEDLKKEEDCPLITVANADYMDESPSSNFKDLIIHSKAIFLAEIGSQTPGFINQVPSLALELRIIRILKGDMNEKRVFIPYPNVKLKVDGTPFCIFTKEHEAQPRSHEKILVFMYHDPIRSKATFLLENPKMLFFSIDGTRISIPQQLKQDPDLNTLTDFKKLLDLTSSKIRRGRTERDGGKLK